MSNDTRLRESDLFSHFEDLDLDSLLAATSRHTVAKRGHVARDFETQKIGGTLGRRIVAAALDQIRPVDARRRHLDEHLARSGLRALTLR